MNRCRCAGAVVAVMSLLAACGSDDPIESSDGEPSSSAQVSAPPSVGTDSADECSGVPSKIGYSPLTLELAWFVIAGDALKATAEACGSEVIVSDPGGDAAQQSAGIDTLLGAGVEALVVYAIDPVSIQPAVEAAQADGVDVIGLASEFDGAYTVGWAFKEGGRQSGVCGGEWLLQEKPDGSPYQVAILHGKSTGQNQIDQYNGMIDGLTESLGAEGFEEIADADVFTEEKAFNDVSTMLRGNPDIDLIVTNNDGAALGAHSAIMDAGLVPGVDVGIAAAGIDERLLAGVAEGSYICSADSAPDLIGAEAVAVAGQLALDADLPSKTEVGGETITSENAEAVAVRLYG